MTQRWRSLRKKGGWEQYEDSRENSLPRRWEPDDYVDSLQAATVNSDPNPTLYEHISKSKEYNGHKRMY